VNLVVWQNVFERYRIPLLTSSLLGITGKLQKNGATVYIAVESCWRPRLEGARADRTTHAVPKNRGEPVATQSRDFR